MLPVVVVAVLPITTTSVVSDGTMRRSSDDVAHAPDPPPDFALISAAISAIKEIATLGATFKNTLVAWFADTANGIGDFFAERVRTRELCIDDICVTRDQFAEVFGSSQSAAAAGAPSSGEAPGAPDGSSANEIPDADAESIPPNGDDTTIAAATSSPEVLSPAKDNEPVSGRYQVIADEPEQEPQLEAANDNPRSQGAEQSSHDDNQPAEAFPAHRHRRLTSPRRLNRALRAPLPIQYS